MRVLPPPLSSNETDRSPPVDPSAGDSEQQLRQLLARQEAERKLIAYELHDTFVQLTVGAKYNIETYLRLRADDPPKAEGMLQAGVRLLDDAIVEARRVISGLRPPILDEAGVMAAIEDLLFETPDDDGPDVEFFHDVEFERLTPELEVGVFRIVQEAVRNARRHSQSETIRLELVERRDNLRIVVQDWGVGFSSRTAPKNHFGLEGICERARLLGGAARIETQPGRGTRIVVHLPLPNRLQS